MQISYVSNFCAERSAPSLVRLVRSVSLAPRDASCLNYSAVAAMGFRRMIALIEATRVPSLHCGWSSSGGAFFVSSPEFSATP